MNVDPRNILKQYADGQKATIKEGTSFDSTTESILQGNMPDLTTRTAGGDLRVTFYKHYTKDNALADKHPGDIMTDREGTQLIQSSEIIPKRRLLTNLGSTVLEKKELAPTVEAVFDDLDKNHQGNITDYINKRKAEDKKYKFGNKTFSIKQIEKAAEASGLTVQEYLDRYKIKSDEDEE